MCAYVFPHLVRLKLGKRRPGRSESDICGDPVGPGGGGGGQHLFSVRAIVSSCQRYSGHIMTAHYCEAFLRRIVDLQDVFAEIAALLAEVC